MTSPGLRTKRAMFLTAHCVRAGVLTYFTKQEIQRVGALEEGKQARRMRLYLRAHPLEQQSVHRFERCCKDVSP
jgi:hypothetical protein